MEIPVPITNCHNRQQLNIVAEDHNLCLFSFFSDFLHFVKISPKTIALNPSSTRIREDPAKNKTKKPKNCSRKGGVVVVCFNTKMNKIPVMHKNLLKMILRRKLEITLRIKLVESSERCYKGTIPNNYG